MVLNHHGFLLLVVILKAQFGAPILFNIYVNNSVKSQLFADDTNFKDSTSDCDQLQSDLDCLVNWQISFKHKLMHLGRSNPYFFAYSLVIEL